MMATNASGTANLTTARILVVEDEALIADDLERTLVRLGFKVPAVVADGEHAIESARTLMPDLVLMDIKLRGSLDGIDAARAIRERFETPVVFLTSHSDAATLSRASTARPHGYVMKPFVERDLRVAVELALHKHEVERTLRVREAWFSTTLHCLGDAILATDDSLVVTTINRAAEQVTGWSRAEAMGKPIDEVFRLQDARGSSVAGPAALALSTREVTHLPGATMLLRANGTTVAVDDSAAPIFGTGGRVLGTVIVFRDVTERRDLEARVARSERLASLGTMAAGLCHEINNPLTSVLANIEHCLAGGPQGEDRECLEDAREAAIRVASIVKEVRVFAQPGDGKTARVDLRQALDQAVKVTAHVLRHHARVVRLDEAAPLVDADPVRLGQVFVNLLVNAAQAIPAGNASAHAVEASLRTDAEGWAVVEVRDDGAGIPPDLVARVFDPFFTTKGPGGGMGLGLAICNSIVEAIGGSISVRSTLGVGSTFAVRLPPAATPPSDAPSGRPKEEASTERARILVVDDEPSVARAIARALSTTHEVETCGDGRAALVRLLGSVPYDLVLCDLLMPEMTGMELYDAVYAARPSQASRFVFLTGTATASELVLRAGRPVITKPIFEIAKLRDFVAEQLRTRLAPS